MKLKTMSEIETMCHEEYTNFLAYGDEIYEELDAETRVQIEQLCLEAADLV